MTLVGVTITVNYPETEVEAAVPTTQSLNELAYFIRQLCETEKDMTSFVVVAAVKR